VFQRSLHITRHITTSCGAENAEENTLSEQQRSPSSLRRSSLKRYLRTRRWRMSALDVLEISMLRVLHTCSRRLCSAGNR